MGRNMNVDMGDELSEFVAGGVQAGGYGPVSEMVRTDLCLLQDQETKKAWKGVHLSRLIWINSWKIGKL